MASDANAVVSFKDAFKPRTSPPPEPTTRTAHLEVINVTMDYGSFRAVDNVSFALSRGERLALLGPSGCGKTTLINVIAGFNKHAVGHVRINGTDVSRRPAYRRDIGVVFQNYALFPHLTVEDNVYFGLKMRRVSKAKAKPAIDRAIELVRLEPFRGRYPHQLSGGQQQRAAIARAIAIEPEILLLDEPLSNLDAKLREQMRTDLLEILDELSITTILVTHDQAEALALADRVAVLNAGHVEQIARPIDAYENPKTQFVAGFLGESNAFDGTVQHRPDGTAAIQIGPQELTFAPRVEMPSGTKARVFIRAERLRVSRSRLATDNLMEARLKHAIYLGGEHRFVLESPIGVLMAVSSSESDLSNTYKTGEKVMVGCSAASLIVLPDDEG
ncbi:ABC transporter ATP-binding protein [Acuticoccus mangrovi]|uniref:ABC transporter ATP-binding protein n=1 Tax=Acuticoccus mangrovi TaxID=2796142 RepID=A0A934MFM9_9HYPH|nr:ABC transporter ATP-binding protein [Acuticoccus mangrovi]MBJ3775648.1 ABC transporter ATP-binding protein [Acuticoccus mangrovi]